MTTSPYRIIPSEDGPRDAYDVVRARPGRARRRVIGDPGEIVHTGTLEECRAEYPGAPVEEREPTDDEIYNRPGMEGGIPYPIDADTRSEHDDTL